ncbi:MAG: serine O-acetyltransferase [Pseudomonadota bacterium]
MAEAAHRQDASNIAELDPIWAELRAEAETATRKTPALGGFFYASILAHETLEDAVCHRLAELLSHGHVNSGAIRPVLRALIKSSPEFGPAFRADLAAVFDRDPACTRYIEPFLYFKGYHALAAHRFAHKLWTSGETDFALFMQSQSSRVFTVDINPATRMGIGIMIDHGHAVVIGQTAVVGDNVSILQGVTLGGTGKETGDRHPKIGDNVLIGAGANVLGNIVVGHCSRIAAGSVVLKDVPLCSTVAGVPARVVGDAGCPEPARTMDQIFPGGVQD